MAKGTNTTRFISPTCVCRRNVLGNPGALQDAMEVLNNGRSGWPPVALAWRGTHSSWPSTTRRAKAVRQEDRRVRMIQQKIAEIVLAYTRWRARLSDTGMVDAA